MKIPSLLLFLLWCPVASATHLALYTVKLPLYLHGSEMDPLIIITDVPFASAITGSDVPFAALNNPFIPASDLTWKTPVDVNLASLYGIKVSRDESRPEEITQVKITIDATAAKVPEGYPFSIAQVTDSVLTCVKLMTPVRPETDEKVTITVLPAAPSTGASPK